MGGRIGNASEGLLILGACGHRQDAGIPNKWVYPRKDNSITKKQRSRKRVLVFGMVPQQGKTLTNA